MPAIVIKTACTEFGRSFAANSVVSDLLELYARALCEAGLASYWNDKPMAAGCNSGYSGWLTPYAADQHALQAVNSGTQLFPAPASGVIPITSVHFATPAKFNIFDGDARTWQYNGALYRRTGGAWVAA